MRARVLFAILLLLLFLSARRLRRAEERVQHFRASLGPGRGAGERAPQQHVERIDVYRQHAAQGDRAFRATTRFTHSQFDSLLAELRPLIESPRNVRPHLPDPQGRAHATMQTTENRLLMVLDFMVNGGSNEAIGARYGVPHAIVSEDIRHVLYAIVTGLSYEVSWPTPEQQQYLHGLLGERFGNAIGTLDGTYTQSLRRDGDFSGHRWLNVRQHQVAADALGYFIHVAAGGAGARHDAFHFRQSGVGELLDADGADLLVDAGYIGVHPRLITPATAARIPDEQERESYNEAHTSRRSRIEAFIGRLKAMFHTMGRRWDRTDRKLLAICFVASCILHNRIKRLNET